MIARHRGISKRTLCCWIAPAVSAEGLTNRAVAERVGASPQAVGKWRRRFIERGVQGLHDELRAGRPRSYDDEKVA